jgi:hypothetical protein
MSKAEALTVQLRVSELIRLRLRGAKFWDVAEYVREKEHEDGSPWKLPEGRKSLCDDQLRVYIKRADTIIRRHGRIKDSELLSQHFSRREDLYAEARVTGDLRTALAVLQDTARLKDLYPAEKKKHEHSGPDGGEIPLGMRFVRSPEKVESTNGAAHARP